MYLLPRKPPYIESNRALAIKNFIFGTCARGTNIGILIIIREGLDAASQKALLRHEYQHSEDMYVLGYWTYQRLYTYEMKSSGYARNILEIRAREAGRGLDVPPANEDIRVIKARTKMELET